MGNGEAIRAERIAVGLTQREIARRAGVHYVTLNKCERGHKPLSALNHARVVAAIEAAKSESACA